MSSLKSHTTTTATTTATPNDGGRAPRPRGLALTGAAATVGAMAATAVAAALAKAAGADFELGADGEAVPVSGAAAMTGIFSIVGVAIAAALRRWSTRPATVFVRVTVTLTALSLIPTFFSRGDTATVAALVVLHLVAAAVMLPALTRALRD